MAETTRKNNDKARAAKLGAKLGAEAEIVANKDVEATQEVATESAIVEEASFTDAELTALIRAKDAVARGEYTDMTPEFKKLGFIKWLVEHGKISG